MFKSPLEIYKDLEWLITSPNLIPIDDSFEAGLNLKLKDKFYNTNKEQLLSLIEISFSYYQFNKIGEYAEKLLHTFFTASSNLKCVAHGFQINNKGKTLGELDFVFKKRENEIHHLEMAVKFYLLTEDEAAFIGPNKNDNLSDKWNLLNQKQMLIGKKYFPEVSYSSLLLKGRLFKHASLRKSKIYFEDKKVTFRGVWDYFENLNESTKECYSVIPKKYWMSDYVNKPEQLKSIIEFPRPKSAIQIGLINNNLITNRVFVIS